MPLICDKLVVDPCGRGIKVLPFSYTPPDTPVVTDTSATLVTDGSDSCLDLSLTFDDINQANWGVKLISFDVGSCRSSHGRITHIKGSYRFKRIVYYELGIIPMTAFWGLWQQYLFGADAVGHPTGGFYFWRGNSSSYIPSTFTTQIYSMGAVWGNNYNGPLNAEVEATGLTGPQFDTDIPVYLGFGFFGGVISSLYSPTLRYDYVKLQFYYDDSPTVSETITLGNDPAWSLESCTDKFSFF